MQKKDIKIRSVEGKDFDCYVVTPDAPGKAIRSHALIGQNGTGKSNLIEALVTIFRELRSGVTADGKAKVIERRGRAITQAGREAVRRVPRGQSARDREP